MNTIILTFVVFLMCVAGMAISLFFKCKPLEKRCSSEPDEGCHCKEDSCESENRK